MMTDAMQAVAGLRADLTVALGERSYPILIGEGLLGQPALWRQVIGGQQVAVITNETVGPLYAPIVLKAL